eukprot:498129_1
MDDLPLFLALSISLIFTIGFIRFIQTSLSKKQTDDARCSIIITIAFLSCYVIYFIALILIHNPSISSHPNIHCVAFLLLRSTAFNSTLYLVQLFYVIRINTVLRKLLINSKCTNRFLTFLMIFLHIVLCTNFVFTFLILVQQYPNMIMDDNCIVLSSSGIRPLINGLYQLLIFITFMFIISNILCHKSQSKHSSRVTRTIIAGTFISLRFFFFPFYSIMDPSYKNWFITLSDILACTAILSEYYHYKQTTSTKQIAADDGYPQEQIELTVTTTSGNIPKEEHTQQTTDDRSTLSALNNTFIDAINNGFTGKEVPPKIAGMVHKFWKTQYSTLSNESRSNLDRTIHDKLRNKIPLPDGRYEDTHFGYLSHLNKLMSNLLRVDISFEKKLRESWGPLHNALGITPQHCELVLDAINEVLMDEFGDAYGVGMEYVFSRLYSTAVSVMLDHHDHGWLNSLLSLNVNEKEIISKSLDACVAHEIGRDIIWKYLMNKAPQIYIFHILFDKYNESDHKQKRSILLQIQRLCLSTHELFTVVITDQLRETFVVAMSLIQDMDSHVEFDEMDSHVEFDEMDRILNAIHDAQMDIVQNLYWKAFALFIF